MKKDPSIKSEVVFKKDVVIGFSKADKDLAMSKDLADYEFKAAKQPFG